MKITGSAELKAWQVLIMAKIPQQQGCYVARKCGFDCSPHHIKCLTIFHHRPLKEGLSAGAVLDDFKRIIAIMTKSRTATVVIPHAGKLSKVWCKFTQNRITSFHTIWLLRATLRFWVNLLAPWILIKIFTNLGVNLTAKFRLRRLVAWW